MSLATYLLMDAWDALVMSSKRLKTALLVWLDAWSVLHVGHHKKFCKDECDWLDLICLGLPFKAGPTVLPADFTGFVVLFVGHETQDIVVCGIKRISVLIIPWSNIILCTATSWHNILNLVYAYLFHGIIVLVFKKTKNWNYKLVLPPIFARRCSSLPWLRMRRVLLPFGCWTPCLY